MALEGSCLLPAGGVLRLCRLVHAVYWKEHLQQHCLLINRLPTCGCGLHARLHATHAHRTCNSMSEESMAVTWKHRVPLSVAAGRAVDINIPQRCPKSSVMKDRVTYRVLRMESGRTAVLTTPTDQLMLLPGPPQTHLLPISSTFPSSSIAASFTTHHTATIAYVAPPSPSHGHTPSPSTSQSSTLTCSTSTESTSTSVTIPGQPQHQSISEIQGDRKGVVAGGKEPHPQQPTPAQLSFILLKLREELPDFFSGHHTFEIYDKKVVFVNKLTPLSLSTRNLLAYQSCLRMLKLSAISMYSRVKLDLIKITKEVEAGEIRARWRVVGVPRLRPWSSETRVIVDGFSTFVVNTDGKIISHSIDKMMKSPPEEKRSVVAWLLQLGMLVGLGAGPSKLQPQPCVAANPDASLTTKQTYVR